MNICLYCVNIFIFIYMFINLFLLSYLVVRNTNRNFFFYFALKKEIGSRDCLQGRRYSPISGRKYLSHVHIHKYVCVQYIFYVLLFLTFSPFFILFSFFFFFFILNSSHSSAIRSHMLHVLNERSSYLISFFAELI